MDSGSSNDDIDPYPYVEGECTAGFFGPFQATQRFYCVRPEEKKELFLELESGECTVCSSTMGLVLCRHSHPSSFRYSVCNPFHKGSRRIIPQPERDHPDSAPRVIVGAYDSNGLCLEFHIVCAIVADEDQQILSYTFDVYSSNTDKWESAVDTLRTSRKIRENTGVSCSITAYWLLDNSSTLVCYQVERRTVITMDIYIPSLQRLSYLPHLQLGQCGPNLFLVASLTKTCQIVVYMKNKEGLFWNLRIRTTYKGPERPTLSRFQSCGLLQVPLWFKETLEMMKIALNANREVLIDCWEWELAELPDSYESMLPHVHSNWLPRLHFPLCRLLNKGK